MVASLISAALLFAKSGGSSSNTGTIVLIVAAVVVFLVISRVMYKQKYCPHCGAMNNKWKFRYPTCQKCGKDRRQRP